MDADPADPPPHQPVRLDEGQGLLVTGEHRLGERRQEREDLLPATEVSARKLPGHERVGPDFAPVQPFGQSRVPPSEMVDPDGGVDQHQAPFPPLRRRIGRRCRSVPPSAESRRALSLAISASRAARTVAVFSRIPESSWASRKSSSSMFSVVRICISMHLICIPVNPGRSRAPASSDRICPTRHQPTGPVRQSLSRHPAKEGIALRKTGRSERAAWVASNTLAGSMSSYSWTMRLRRPAEEAILEAKTGSRIPIFPSSVKLS